MCGITGIVYPEAHRYEESLKRMTECLGHRGPDGYGVYFFKNCAFGHRRLSVVDLRTGHQPMLSAIANIGITFNGEIYGYRELRASCEDYPFRTSSDTEVLLALYHRYGKFFLSHLPGMFAFALWDDEKQELWCGRDRFGEKPFYYAFGKHGEFLFASEIKALIASGLIRPVLNMEAVIHYIKYLYVNPRQTIYSNIYTLPPACLLHYKEGHMTVERYWNLPETRDDVELPEAVEQFRKLIDQSVAKQLVADVPVGIFLSGGLDSSTIVAVASRHKDRLKTFSFDFENSQSELPFAREVAHLYETEHVELADTHSNIANLLQVMQEFYDEPFADSSNIPTYLIAKLARKFVKVVLTGDGADELLAGYSFWYKPLLHMQQKAWTSKWLFDVVHMSLKLSMRAGMLLMTELKHKILGSQYQRFYHSLMQAHRAQQVYFKDDELISIGLQPLKNESIGFNQNISDTLDDVLRTDIEDYMPGDILVKTDRASMANGLELRTPFLDVDFASFCISLPYRLKINSEEDKLILRRAFANMWPKAILNRGKQGFGAPVKKWLKRDSVKALKEKYLNDPEQKIFSLISFKEGRKFMARDDYKTWILLVLALWLDKHDFEV